MIRHAVGQASQPDPLLSAGTPITSSSLGDKKPTLFNFTRRKDQQHPQYTQEHTCYQPVNRTYHAPRAPVGTLPYKKEPDNKVDHPDKVLIKILILL